MNLTKHWSLLLAVMVVIFAFGWSGYGQKANRPERAWEYKVVHEYYGENAMRRNLPIGAKELNEYGSQGWELVSIIAEVNPAEKTFYFKRSK